jgi:membrane-bound ClpP family serine protease
MDSVKNLLILIGIAFILFEVVEHVVLPLFWLLKDRKMLSVCGEAGMLGKVGEVIDWQETEGKVFVNGEIWRAVSDDPLSPMDKVIIKKLKGLTLKVAFLKG